MVSLMRADEASLILLICIPMIVWASSNVSAVDQHPKQAILRTEYGTKLVVARTNATDVTATPEIPPRDEATINLVLGLAMLSIPLIIVLVIHLFLSCRKLRNVQAQQKASQALSPDPSVTLQEQNTFSQTTPPLLTRAKSKSVTWQSPFETKGRRSHRNISNLSSAATSELHFVMVATPERQRSSRQSLSDQRQPRRRSYHQSHGEDFIPPYRLDRLDSPPQEEVATLCQSTTQTRRSPIPILEDSGNYDSDSPRVSMSSAISDDPDIIKIYDAVEWTRETHDFTASARVMRSSSSLDDFRHDLHHENDQEDPDQITRSSEYSF